MKKSEVIQAYVEKFKQNFPLYEYYTYNEDEIIEEMKKCIENNEPYKSKIKENVMY